MLIFLVGMMGSGKTSVGRLLAERLAVPFYDTDEIISSLEDMSISDIFAHKGEAAFRQLERELIQHWKMVEGVVATGGGLPCQDDMMEVLHEKGTTVYLQVSIPEIVHRLQQDTTRPLVAGKTDKEVTKIIQNLSNARKPFYQKANIKVIGKGDVLTIVKKIQIKLLEKEINAL